MKVNCCWYQAAKHCDSYEQHDTLPAVRTCMYTGRA